MNTLLLASFGLIILILGIVIIALCFFYTNLVSKLHQAQKQNLYLRFHVQEKGLEKINLAKDKSAKIISDAIQQAEEILKKAELLNADTNQQAKAELEAVTKQQKESLNKASTELVHTFDEAMKHLQQENINIAQNITKNVEEVASNEIKAFEKQLHDETVGQQKVIDQKIQDAFAKEQADIAAYKKDKLAAIDQQIYTVLQKATKEVIGKRLTFDDHKDLIIAALERAKSEMSVS